MCSTHSAKTEASTVCRTLVAPDRPYGARSIHVVPSIEGDELGTAVIGFGSSEMPWAQLVEAECTAVH